MSPSPKRNTQTQASAGAGEEGDQCSPRATGISGSTWEAYNTPFSSATALCPPLALRQGALSLSWPKPLSPPSNCSFLGSPLQLKHHLCPSTLPAPSQLLVHSAFSIPLQSIPCPLPGPRAGHPHLLLEPLQTSPCALQTPLCSRALKITSPPYHTLPASLQAL